MLKKRRKLVRDVYEWIKKTDLENPKAIVALKICFELMEEWYRKKAA